MEGLLSAMLMLSRFHRPSWLQGSGPGSGSCMPRFSHRRSLQFTFLHVSANGLMSKIPTVFHNDNRPTEGLPARIEPIIFSGLAGVSASEHVQVSRMHRPKSKCTCSRPTPHSSYFRQGFGRQLGDYAPGLAVGLVPLSVLTNPKP